MSGTRGPYAGTAHRRQQILETAWDVFAVQGYRGGSLREISARLGFSTAGISHHFASKEGLLLAVLQHREDMTTAADLADIGLLDHLRTVVARNAATPGAVRLYVTLSAEATDPDHPAHAYFVQRYTEIVDRYTAAFTQALRDGDLTPGTDPAATAQELVAFLDGIQLQWLLTPTFDMVSAYDHYIAPLRAAGPGDTAPQPRDSRLTDTSTD